MTDHLPHDEHAAYTPEVPAVIYTGLSRADYLAMAVKGLLGAIPFVGPFAAELLGTVIPNQRNDRAVKLTERLGAEVVALGLEQERLKTAFSSPGFVDLF